MGWDSETKRNKTRGGNLSASCSTLGVCVKKKQHTGEGAGPGVFLRRVMCVSSDMDELHR